PAPDNHFAACPHCSVKESRFGCVARGSICPAISARIVPPAGVYIARGIRDSPAPDDHFTAGPDRCVIVAGSGRIGGRCGCPTICDGVVSSAWIQNPALG